MLGRLDVAASANKVSTAFIALAPLHGKQVLQAQQCMQGKITSFIGSRMGLLRVVGRHPAVEAAVFVWHAKRGIFRPSPDCW
jgi:hypothetical protein